MIDVTNHADSSQYRACELRVAAHDYPTIADKLGVTPAKAQRLVRTGLEQRAALRDPETEYLLSVERFRGLLDAVKEEAEVGNKKAISLTVRIIELWESLKVERAAQCAARE